MCECCMVGTLRAKDSGDQLPDAVWPAAAERQPRARSARRSSEAAAPIFDENLFKFENGPQRKASDQRRQITSDQNSLANLNNNHVLKSCLTLRGPFAIASCPCQASKAVHLTRCLGALRARLQCKAAKFSGASGGRAREGLWSE